MTPRERLWFAAAFGLLLKAEMKETFPFSLRSSSLSARNLVCAHFSLPSSSLLLLLLNVSGHLLTDMNYDSLGGFESKRREVEHKNDAPLCPFKTCNCQFENVCGVLSFFRSAAVDLRSVCMSNEAHSLEIEAGVWSEREKKKRGGHEQSIESTRRLQQLQT